MTYIVYHIQNMLIEIPPKMSVSGIMGQLKEDELSTQLTLEDTDPFTGNR